jgi:hypothetical protein
MRGGKWLFANLTVDQLIYDLWTRTDAHQLVVRMTLRALKLLIINHSTSPGWFSHMARADMHIAEELHPGHCHADPDAPLARPKPKVSRFLHVSFIRCPDL